MAIQLSEYVCVEHDTPLIYFVENGLYYCPECDEFMDEVIDELFFESVFQDVENVSQYLLEYQYLSPVFAYDGLLLQKESMLWWNLTICVQELGRIYSDNNLIKTLFLSKDILDDMVDIVDDIIDVQNEIIDQEI